MITREAGDVRLFDAPIGKKLVMAVTGAILAGYLVAHMLGNLQIFAGATKINDYARLLHASPTLLWGARAVLLGSIALHVRAGLLRHIALEEKIFYAEARARSKEIGARTAPLRREHGALTSLLVPTPDRALVEEIRSILTPHDALEEGDGGVYAACETVLDDHAAVMERMRVYPPVPVAAHFDGPAVPRTAAAALAVAARQKVSRGG